MSSSNSSTYTCPRSQNLVLNEFSVSFELKRVHVRTFTVLSIEQLSCFLRIRPRTCVHVHRTWYWLRFMSPLNSCVYTCARSQYSVLNNFPVFFEFVHVHMSTFTVLSNKQLSCLLRIRPRIRAHVHRTRYWMSFLSSWNSSVHTCAHWQYLVLYNFPVFFQTRARARSQYTISNNFGARTLYHRTLYHWTLYHGHFTTRAFYHTVT